jgi:hypothetical protein
MIGDVLTHFGVSERSSSGWPAKARGYGSSLSTSCGK